MIAGSLALVAAGGFAGAAFYDNYVEQPARLALDDDSLAKEWKPSDHRGFAVLAVLALASAIFGFVAYRELDDLRWLLGALVMISSWPYTYFAIVPLNNKILALIDGGATHDARAAISLWGLLEWGQIGIGALAVLIYLWAAG
jgi:hypothetical protein